MKLYLEIDCYIYNYNNKSLRKETWQTTYSVQPSVTTKPFDVFSGYLGNRELFLHVFHLLFFEPSRQVLLPVGVPVVSMLYDLTALLLRCCHEGPKGEALRVQVLYLSD